MRVGEVITRGRFAHQAQKLHGNLLTRVVRRVYRHPAKEMKVTVEIPDWEGSAPTRDSKLEHPCGGQDSRRDLLQNYAVTLTMHTGRPRIGADGPLHHSV